MRQLEKQKWCEKVGGFIVQLYFDLMTHFANQRSRKFGVSLAALLSVSHARVEASTKLA